MQSRQAGPPGFLADTALRFERLGPLPLVNAFIERLDLEARLERFVPSEGRRVRLPFARALMVLLRSLLVEREPIHRQAEVVAGFAPTAFGLTPAHRTSRTTRWGTRWTRCSTPIKKPSSRTWWSPPPTRSACP